MISESIIDSTIETLFRDIEFTKEPSGLYDPLRYMIAIGGKRLRPRLCLTTYSLFKDSFDEGILSPATGIEVFHTFTLIHDDIMDKSPLRRGSETVWKKWSPDTAILSGDVMCIDSYKRIAKAPKEVLGDVLELFSRTAAEVCDGQQYDMEFETKRNVSMAEYMNMIGKKTAVLIACPAKMGAMIALAPKEVCDAVYQYGYNLGLAFQVADDWLDAYGDSKVFGKPIGGDIVNGKKSWLTVRSMEKGAEGLLEAMESDLPDKDKIAAVMAIYDKVGVGEEAENEIERLTDKALDAIRPILSKEQFATLETFARKLTGRRK